MKVSDPTQPKAPPAVSNVFAEKLAAIGSTLQRGPTEILQLNLGKRCNLTCTHCHVNAGPSRRESLSRESMDRILDWLGRTRIPTVDLTGGAPEMHPHFRELILAVRSQNQPRRILDRCNLTILLEPGYESLAEFLAAQRVEIVASMPCYEPANVNAQRGDGVFDASIRALQLLNSLGYGRTPDLPLSLVYNPVGAKLPPSQAALETDYREALGSHFGIEFSHLFTITNMPIARFAAELRHTNQLQSYMQLLIDAFNPATLSGLMCRNTVSVSWLGEVFDCDFNQMLGMHWRGRRGVRLWEIDPAELEGGPIETGDHCFGCTAGCGSSCGGSLTEGK